MTIFDYLKDILVTKKGDLPLNEYVPFLVNRWLSFINPQIGSAINQINNKTLMEDKEMHYKLMLNMFPKIKYVPKINYIKKAETNKEGTPSEAIFLAKQLELSEREVSLLSEMNIND